MAGFEFEVTKQKLSWGVEKLSCECEHLRQLWSDILSTGWEITRGIIWKAEPDNTGCNCPSTHMPCLLSLSPSPSPFVTCPSSFFTITFLSFRHISTSETTYDSSITSNLKQVGEEEREVTTTSPGSDYIWRSSLWFSWMATLSSQLLQTNHMCCLINVIEGEKRLIWSWERISFVCLMSGGGCQKNPPKCWHLDSNSVNQMHWSILTLISQSVVGDYSL